jgi:hypothetical protein
LYECLEGVHHHSGEVVEAGTNGTVHKHISETVFVAVIAESRNIMDRY